MSKRDRLYYIGHPEDGFGWGVANTNLIRELGKQCDLVTTPRTRQGFECPAFAPIGALDLSPEAKWKSPYLMGYCFTEWPIHPNARANSWKYHKLFCGSTWNQERLAAAGIKSEPLIQGINREVFKPMPWNDKPHFIVFSGGKFEFRKGQDYVIAALRRFMAIRKDVFLIASWHNPWAESAVSMHKSWLIDAENPFADLPHDRIFFVPPCPNREMAKIYSQAHIGIFPNRCEAGTNLVMSEFMACGRPVIASYATGHRDVLNADYRFLLKEGSWDPAGWFNCNVSDIIWHLEAAYQERWLLPAMGEACAEMTSSLSWEKCASQILAAADPWYRARDQKPELSQALS